MVPFGEARPRHRCVRRQTGPCPGPPANVARRINGTRTGASLDLHQAGKSASTAPPASLGRLIDGAASGPWRQNHGPPHVWDSRETSLDLNQAGDRGQAIASRACPARSVRKLWRPAQRLLVRPDRAVDGGSANFQNRRIWKVGHPVNGLRSFRNRE